MHENQQPLRSAEQEKSISSVIEYLERIQALEEEYNHRLLYRGFSSHEYPEKSQRKFKRKAKENLK